MSELKPCPFCGGEAAMWEGRYSEDSFADKPWVVRCKSCDARMAIMPEYGDGNYWWIHGDEGISHMREVINEAWNTRAERTCRWEAVTNPRGEVTEFMCECGCCMGYIPSFCPSCGARAVES